MFNMSSQDTRRKIRLNEKVESRVRGDLYARFGGEYLETYHYKRWKGAGCLAYGGGAMERESEYRPAEEDVPLSGRIWLFHLYLHARETFLRLIDGNLYGQHVGAALGGLHSRGS